MPRTSNGGFGARTVLVALLALSPVLASADPPASLPPASIPPIFSMPASSSAVDVLQQDARLDTPVTLDKTAVSLDDLTKELSHKGLLLFAGRACENQRVHVRLNKRTLRDLMRALAELLPGEWKPREGKSGYILIMNPAAVAYRERWQRLRQEDRERANDVMRASLIAAMRGPDNSPISYPGTDAGGPATGTIDHTNYNMFHSLPADLQDKIAANINDIAIDTQLFTGDVNEGSVSASLDSLPGAFRDTVNSDLAALYQGKKMSQSDVTVRFYNIGFSACMGLKLSDGQWVYSNHNSAGASPFDIPAVRGGYTRSVRFKGAAAPAEWKELAAYEQSRVWKNNKPLYPYSKAWGAARRGDLLTWIAQQTGIEYVSDCYADWRGPLPPAQRTAPDLTDPLARNDTKELLNEIAAAHDVSWKQGSKNIYLLRNNRWYMDDFAEVPAPLLHTWLTQWTPPQAQNAGQQTGAARGDTRRYAPAAPLTLAQIRTHIDRRALVIGSLTPQQIAGGFSYMSVDTTETVPGQPPRPTTIYPFIRIANALLRERGTARFFEHLTSEQRDLLAAGQLPFAALAPAVQGEAARLLPALSEQTRKSPAWLGLESVENDLRGSFVNLRHAIDPGPDLRLIVSTEPKSPTGK